MLIDGTLHTHVSQKKTRGMLEELEKAHIYIARLNTVIMDLEERAREGRGEIECLTQQVEELNNFGARLAKLEKRISP